MTEPLIGYLLIERGAAPGDSWRRSLLDRWRPCARHPEFAYGNGGQLWRAQLHGVSRAPGFDLHPDPLRCAGYTLLEQLPAWWRYGPRGAALEEVFATARRLTPAAAQRLADTPLVLDLTHRAPDDPRLRFAVEHAALELRRLVEGHSWAVNYYAEGPLPNETAFAALQVLMQRAEAILRDA